jgi:hypothetical protein
MEWHRKYHRRIMVPLLCLLLTLVIWGVIHKGATGVQIFCLSVMLLALAGSTVNNRRSQALHEALFSLFYAALAVELWSRDRSLPLALPWVLLVSFFTWSAIDTYVKSKTSHCDAGDPNETPCGAYREE